MLTRRLARSIDIVQTNISNITKLNPGKGRFGSVSINVSRYPISPIIMTVTDVNEIPRSENVSCKIIIEYYGDSILIVMV